MCVCLCEVRDEAITNGEHAEFNHLEKKNNTNAERISVSEENSDDDGNAHNERVYILNSAHFATSR